VLFLIVALLIVAARLRPRYAPYEEPPELVKQRLDLENNAYYALVEAVALLPMPPFPVQYVKNEATEEEKFTPERGSVASLIGVRRTDDDPLLLDYIDKAKPAVELARAAISKPFFLFPPVDWTVMNEQIEKATFQNLPLLHQLTGLLVLDAASKPCSLDPGEDACHRMREVLELSFRMSADRYSGFALAEKFAADVIRKSSIEHQRETMQWLEETRRAWTPRRAAIDFTIWHVLKAELPVDPNYRPNMWERIHGTVKGRIRLASDKLFVRRHEKLYREAAELTFHQYDRQKERFKPIQVIPRHYVNLCLHGACVNANSRFFACVDGLRIAIALELYRRDRESYPDKLDSLVPDYLPELPKSPYDGRDFEYHREGNDYALSCAMKSVHYYAAASHAGKLVFHAPASARPAR
jgi:hypothetical protein